MAQFFKYTSALMSLIKTAKQNPTRCTHHGNTLSPALTQHHHRAEPVPDAPGGHPQKTGITRHAARETLHGLHCLILMQPTGSTYPLFAFLVAISAGPGDIPPTPPRPLWVILQSFTFQLL